MTNVRLTEFGRGTFSCRIDGRAGYLRLWDDRLELVRAGRREPEVIPLHRVTGIAAGKPGRLFTAVEIVADAPVELKFPSVDAVRIADLIATLAEAAEPPAAVEAPAPLPTEPEAELIDPAVLGMLTEHEAIDPSVLGALAEWTIPPVDMPEWVPLPESGAPELVLSQIVLEELTPEPVATVAAEPITEIEPLPEGSVLAAAAALADLEHLLHDVPPAPPGSVVQAADEMLENAREILTLTQSAPESDEVSAPVPSEAVLTLAAAAMLGGSRPPAAEQEIPKPRPERPEDLPEDLVDRLSRLEVLRNCGIMSEADFADAEAEILSLVESGRGI